VINHNVYNSPWGKANEVASNSVGMNISWTKSVSDGNGALSFTVGFSESELMIYFRVPCAEVIGIGLYEKFFLQKFRKAVNEARYHEREKAYARGVCLGHREGCRPVSFAHHASSEVDQNAHDPCGE
jgi:hypothetical protein